MTMTLDANQHRFGALNLDHMSYTTDPHFTNPWAASSSPAPGTTAQNGNQNIYVSSQDGAVLPQLSLNPIPKHPHHHSSRAAHGASMGSYASLPPTTASAGSAAMPDVYRQQDLLPIGHQDLLSMNRLQHPTSSAAYDTSAYTTTASPVNATYAASPTYDQMGYAPAPMRGAFALASGDSSRRYSQQSVASSFIDLGAPVEDGSNRPPGITLSDYDRRGLQPDDRGSFRDAIEASHGLASLSQDTPRNLHEARLRQRGSGDSYGFPATHSTNSSISSAGFSGYYGGSVGSSVSEYSTTGSDISDFHERALPRPQGLMSNQPPAPQSMMGSFSSKVSSSTQKKHKCKVCDKRFTRPSSLQTHMYSHTGEKPYRCEVDGCGRHFSVVSNLRRHKKVHRNQGGETPSEASETGSEDHHSE